MERMTPVDHFHFLFETEMAAMNMGALLLFEVPEGEKANFEQRVRAHLERYAPRTVLARRLVEAPDLYDANAWFGISAAAVREQIRTPSLPAPLSDGALRRYVVERGLRHLDLSRAPFEIDILDQVGGAQCAIYMKLHHARMDGVGFQNLLMALSDQGCDGLTGEEAQTDEEIPTPERWTALLSV